MIFNIWAILVAAVSTLLIGFIWYHPKVFGTVWMKVTGLTETELKRGNMIKIFGLAFLFAIFLAMTMYTFTVHQSAVIGLVGADPDNALPSYNAFMQDYGDAFRTYKHGALHGFLAGIFVALPILGTNALFERKSAKYIFINAGFWIVCFTVMGAIICGWR